MIRRKRVGLVYYGGPLDGRREVLLMKPGDQIIVDEWDEVCGKRTPCEDAVVKEHVYSYDPETHRLVYGGVRPPTKP